MQFVNIYCKSVHVGAKARGLVKDIRVQGGRHPPRVVEILPPGGFCPFFCPKDPVPSLGYFPGSFPTSQVSWSSLCVSECFPI